ncbi:MAG: hypothetical protein OEU95_01505 [Nitrospirota bacterium]|nr:hypothetical protein [Nitrospirota bacterium]
MIRILSIVLGLLVMAVNVYAVEDTVSIEQQRLELKQKEEQVKTEIERLETIRREVAVDIDKYTKLLDQINKSLEQAEVTGTKRLKHVAKAYESMQPEDAASRLSGLDTGTAVQILLMMNSKKAGLVIGMMDSYKAMVLTKEIAQMKK